MQAGRMILGLDIGGTNFRMGLVGEDLQPHLIEVTSSRSLFEFSDPLAALALRVKEYLAVTQHQFVPAMICAGLPAVLDSSRRYVRSATNFPGMEGRNVVSYLENALGLPVMIEHDAYYLLAYDIMCRGLKNQGTMMGCYFGTGLGNAVFINGQPYIGKNGVACELGHMPVPLSDIACSCGNFGCIEMYSCGKALERLAQESFPNESISTLFVNHSNSDVLSNFIRYMAAAVATEVNILDPDYVFLGGGIVHMKSFPKEFFRQAILANTRKPFPAENLCLEFAKDSPENGIIGAAIEGFRKNSQTFIERR